MQATTLKIVIIDDEQDARATLRAFLESLCPNVEILGEAQGFEDGIALIRNSHPDVVLLDIQLGHKSGFDLLDKFEEPNFQVIFCTAYDQFALKAIKYAALDYLVKPIDPKELIKAIDKAKANRIREHFSILQIQQLVRTTRTKTFERITLYTAEGLVFLRLSDIQYLQSDVNYTLFFTSENEKIIVSKTLKDYDEMLPKDRFCRVHQSFIVNTHSVKKILREDGGFAVMENGEKIPISRRKKEAFLKLMTKG